MRKSSLWKLAYHCLYTNSSQEGFCASGKSEIYGCFFGRDSALTILKVLKAHTKKPALDLLEISRRSLLTLVSLQGKEFNVESGEQPGKFIHEFRKEPSQYEHLLRLERPFYVYPDGLMKIYDSIDSTPLGLIAIYKYYEITSDSDFLMQVLPSVESALNWIVTYGDMDKDGLLEYDFPVVRKHGGLVVQSWTDSNESMMDERGNLPDYPIAPVEVQGYAFLALKLWGNFYLDHSPQFAQKLLTQAELIKKVFNQKFIISDRGNYFAAQALDGNKNQIKTITANPLLCLWASYFDGKGLESVIEEKYIKDFVGRAFLEDMFSPAAGLRTMSSLSKTFDGTQRSYHNGSFWPILNGMCQEGLENWGFKAEANRLKKATIKPIRFFKTPIELYVLTEEGQYLEYKNEHGQVSCREQAWSAAALLDLISG